MFSTLMAREYCRKARAKLFIVAEKDSFAPLAATKATYEKAKEPKAMKTFPVLHFEMYEEPWTSKAAGEAINWYKQYL